MNLNDVLRDKASDIIKGWRNKVIDSYPENTRHFIKKEKNRFANPVGYIIEQDMERLYYAFVEQDEEGMNLALSNIIRVRAVQDFSPSSALYFILELKDVIQKEVENFEEYPTEDIEALDRRIISLLLMGFDIYEQCRYRLYELRVNEVRQEVSGLLKMANLVYEVPDEMTSK